MSADVRPDTGGRGPQGDVGPQGPALLTVPSLEAYGHSWANDYGATNARYGLVQRLANALGKATVNRVATTGGFVAGTAANGAVGSLLINALATDLTAAPFIARGGLKLCAIGYNDAATYSGITNGDLVVENALRLAYSRLLAARVVPAVTAGPVLNAALTYATGWTAQNDVTASPTPGRAYHATNGKTVDLALDSAYQGEAITAMLQVGPGACIADISIDGGASIATANLNTLETVLGAAGVSVAAVCLRVPAGVIAPGSHTVRITFSSINSFALFTGFIVEGRYPPPLLLPNYPLLVGNAAVLSGAPWSNSRIQNAAAAFPSAAYVDLGPAMAPSYPAADTQYWNAGLPGHPNNLGYGRCASVLLQAAAPLLTPDVVARMN